jgi:hypothetical protein
LHGLNNDGAKVYDVEKICGKTDPEKAKKATRPRGHLLLNEESAKVRFYDKRLTIVLTRWSVPL